MYFEPLFQLISLSNIANISLVGCNTAATRLEQWAVHVRVISINVVYDKMKEVTEGA